MTSSDRLQIMHAVAVVYQVMHYREFGFWPTRTGTVESFRAALRLDDPKLDALIRQGAHKRPWSKEAVRA